MLNKTKQMSCIAVLKKGMNTDNSWKTDKSWKTLREAGEIQSMKVF